jgi:hypothetical protein
MALIIQQQQIVAHIKKFESENPTTEVHSWFLVTYREQASLWIRKLTQSFLVDQHLYTWIPEENQIPEVKQISTQSSATS